MIEQIFEQQGWRTERLGMAHYKHHKNRYNFEVKPDNNRFVVTTPLIGSDLRYQTKFDSYEQVETYMQMHLDYIEIFFALSKIKN
jgi:hypothetical protein